jgi:hypothetical protein
MCILALGHQAVSAEVGRIAVSADRRGFVVEASGKRFVPCGFNYDHDETGRLLEDYWVSEWAKVKADFQEMKQLGANVVRIHLQLGKFIQQPDQPVESSLRQLGRLVTLAESLQLYLDVTGLGCYHKQDVPPWYDALSEQRRWHVQAHFWSAVAARCAASPAIFCYDLMNEPVVPGGRRAPGDWLGPAFAGKHFVQFISLDRAGRARTTIASAWIRQLASAIRKHDRRHLITVGLVPWSLNRPGLTSGFEPGTIASELDFLSVHLYPKRSGVEESLEILAGFSVGKPVLIEETFPLKCPIADFKRFIEASRKRAAGWIGFYWGRTPEQCRASTQLRDSLMLNFLEFFIAEAARSRAQSTD